MKIYNGKVFEENRYNGNTRYVESSHVICQRKQSYRLVWFCDDDCCCCCCCCCGCNGNWKKGNPPLPRAYGICPFHLLIDCHCRYCGSCLNWSVITLIACASPSALATFDLAVLELEQLSD